MSKYKKSKLLDTKVDELYGYFYENLGFKSIFLINKI